MSVKMFIDQIQYDIWGSNDGKDADVGLLGSNAVWTFR
jgi:hypothetical protein